MKKRLSTFLLLFALPCLLIFSACGNQKERQIDSSNAMTVNLIKNFNFSNNQFLFEYGDDVSFNYDDDFDVVLNYDDGSKKTLSYGDKSGYIVVSTIPEKNAQGKVDAGEYNLTLKHVEGENDEIEVTKYFTVKVSKKKIQNPVLRNSSFVFNGSSVDASQYVDFKGNQNLIELSGDRSASSVGTYCVRYQIKNDYFKNYEFVNTTTELVWKIKSAVVKFPTVAGGLKARYDFVYVDGETNSIIFNFDKSSDLEHISWTFSSEITKTISSDEKVITFSINQKGNFEIECMLDEGYEFDNGSSNLIQITIVVD